MTEDLVWEWSVGGERIRARLDQAQGFESVLVGAKLVSRAPIGTMPEGHEVVATTANIVVTLDPLVDRFVLRVDGQVVPPAVEPKVVPLPPLPPPSKVPRIIVTLLLATSLVIAVVFAFRTTTTKRPGVVLAATRLVRLHYTSGFDPKETTENTQQLPRADGTYARMPVSVISGFDPARDEAIFAVSAVTRGTLLLDSKSPWRLGEALRGELQGKAEAHLERHLTLRETGREDTTCAGKPGAAVTSAYDDGKESGTLWTCSFYVNGNAYLLGYIVSARSAEDAPKLRALVDQMEIFHTRAPD